MKTALSILGSFLLLILSFESFGQQKTFSLSYSNNPPFTAVENGKEKGVAIEIMNKIFERAKLPFKYKNEPLARGMASAKTDEYNCVFPVQRAQDIEADYQWVSPIFVTQSLLLANADFKTSLMTLSDAKQLSVGALLGSGDSEYLKKFGYKIQEVSAQEQNLEKLKAKRIELWATDNISAAYFIKRAGVADKDAMKEVYAFRKTLGSLACNSNVAKADIEKLQDTLDAMIVDGTIEKLMTTTL